MQQWLTTLGTQNTKTAYFDENFVLCGWCKVCGHDTSKWEYPNANRPRVSRGSPPSVSSSRRKPSGLAPL